MLHLAKAYIKHYTEVHQSIGAKVILIDKFDMMRVLGCSDRTARKAFSSLRKEGVYYTPMRNPLGMYRLVGTDEQIRDAEKYAWRIIKTIQSLSRDDLRPILPLIKDEKLRNKIGQAQLIEDEKEGQDLWPKS